MSPSQSENTISKLKFEAMRKEWIELDDKYDSLFQEFLDSPSSKNSEDIAEFKKMQARLYELEDELYKIAEGLTTIEE